MKPSAGFSRINPEVHLLVLLALFFGYMVLYMPTGGGDQNFWIEWATYIYKSGIRHIYDLHRHPAPGVEPSFLYGPFFMYLLRLFVAWQGSIEAIQQNVHQLKVILLVFDMVGIWFALRYLPDKYARPFYALFFLFNLGLLYDTVSWGQVDGVVTCLLFLAVHFALKQRIAISGICFIASLLIKPQPIIFLPVIGLIWLLNVSKSTYQKTILNAIVVLIATFALLWPFIQADTLNDYWAMMLDTPNIYNMVTVNAANIWNILLVEDPDTVVDMTIRYGLSYKQWGLMMFSVCYGVILFPLLKQCWYVLTNKRPAVNATMVLLIAGLVPICFYFFNTQMHERYANSSMLFLGAYALASRDFIPYVVASVANFAVMDKFLRIFDFHFLRDHITLLQIALLFLFVLVWGVVRLYKTNWSNEQTIGVSYNHAT